MKILLFVFGLFLSLSCSTALHVPRISKVEIKKYPKERMEFIGFKNSRRNNYLLKDFGAELERNNIALNKQDFYMGVYSLQELETYKSTMRYVTFVDIKNFSNSWNDGVYDKDGLATGGWIIAGLTAFLLVPVYVPMICCANQNYCKLDVLLNCSIQVYDTYEKKIVLSIPIEVREDEVYKGQYYHKKTDRQAVMEYGKTLIYNALLENFDKAYVFLESQKE